MTSGGLARGVNRREGLNLCTHTVEDEREESQSQTEEEEEEEIRRSKEIGKGGGPCESTRVIARGVGGGRRDGRGASTGVNKRDYVRSFKGHFQGGWVRR